MNWKKKKPSYYEANQLKFRASDTSLLARARGGRGALPLLKTSLAKWALAAGGTTITQNKRNKS